ncbi:hypothetical protein NLG97_g4292 [Lecanicillium saksenae]|uniref:Uncharacterized protein n=1 Tax=Lecanicillium saksenae TaxID=468837 RepID=A0ACC1QVR5_9HYPO|nr:hypothetical protein NLG97_g4292 [Lecanicillium saksenae]
MGLIGGAIKLIIIPIVLVLAIAVLGGIYLKHRRNKAINDVEQPQFPPPVSAAPPVYAPSPVQYMAPAKPAPVATVQGYS